MNIQRIKLTAYMLSAMFLASCGAQKSSKQTQNRPQQPSKPAVVTKTQPTKPVATVDAELLNLKLPEVNREFRAAWIATVANINWPSKNNLSTEQQKSEAIRILDQLKAANFNAVVFQARPSSDAFYKSSFEPWSYFLTGEAGKAPNPYYDPLDFWISEAHKRGMELHLWLNPYRAYHTAGGPMTGASMVQKMPDDVVRLKNGTYWFDPSSQKVQDHVSAVVKDLVKRYDVDAIHFDDYFYPYAEYNGGADFPDSKTWSVYRNSGGTLSKADWRRASVNKFVKRIYEEIHAEKNYVKFGISPFGIWKSGYPAGIKGSSQYDELFADAKLWLNEGWVDYFAPQLYWKIGGPQDFNSLLNWWKAENTKNRHLWPGLNTVGVRGVSDKAGEISNQIRAARSILQDKAGVIHYSMDGISKNPAMFSALQDIYKDKALVPASQWIKTEKVLKPEINARKKGGNVETDWLSRAPQQPRNWILYAKYGDSWETKILDSEQTSLNLPLNKLNKELKIIALKAVDRLGNESEYAAVKVQ